MVKCGQQRGRACHSIRFCGVIVDNSGFRETKARQMLRQGAEPLASLLPPLVTNQARLGKPHFLTGRSHMWECRMVWRGCLLGPRIQINRFPTIALYCSCTKRSPRAPLELLCVIVWLSILDLPFQTNWSICLWVVVRNDKSLAHNVSKYHKVLRISELAPQCGLAVRGVSLCISEF